MREMYSDGQKRKHEEHENWSFQNGKNIRNVSFISIKAVDKVAGIYGSSVGNLWIFSN